MSRSRIVIVQDNPADIELIRMALDQLQEPYQLNVLHDGAEALRFVQEQHLGFRDPEPCAIVLNLYLPKYDGLEVLQALRKEPKLRHVQVVMLTSSAVPRRDIMRMEAIGAIVWPKPRQFSEVLELASYVLDLCRKAVSVA